MSPDAYATELALREAARKSHESALVLADFYEAQGQPTRAYLWRRSCGVFGEPQKHWCKIPDLTVSMPNTYNATDPRKTAMIALLANLCSGSVLGKLFGLSSGRIYQIKERMRGRAYAIGQSEQKHPTMAATKRLFAANAFRIPTLNEHGVDTDILFRRVDLFGEVPPDTWPATRPHEIKRVEEQSRTKDRSVTKENPRSVR